MELITDKKVKTRFFGTIGYGFSVCEETFQNVDPIIVYSFGIGEDLSFSREFAETYTNCEIYAFDPTPKAIDYVEDYDKSIFHKFEFYPFGLSDGNFKTKFFLPKNKEHVSGSEIVNPSVDKSDVIEVQMHTLQYIMDRLGHSEIHLLKMDIEGSEFAAVSQFLNGGARIHQICVEVHNRFYADGDKRLDEMLKTLREKGYELVNISVTKEELTFIKERENADCDD